MLALQDEDCWSNRARPLNSPRYYYGRSILNNLYIQEIFPYVLGQISNLLQAILQNIVNTNIVCPSLDESSQLIAQCTIS